MWPRPLPSTEEMSRFMAVMDILKGKWTREILWFVGHGDARFGELNRQLPDVTPKMLAQRLKQLEQENQRLKKMVADLSLDKDILNEALKGNY